MIELGDVTPEAVAAAVGIKERIKQDLRGIAEYDAWYAKTAREQIRQRAVEMSEAGLFPLVTVVKKFGDEKPKKLLLIPVEGSDREPEHFLETGFEPLYRESEFINPQGEVRTYYGVGVGMIYGPAGSRLTDDRKLVEVAEKAFSSMQWVIDSQLHHQASDPTS